ncbi:methyltransferase domain-containing protein [Henriciella mobilis]|uniref:methyltransferase domain-containing protein n=1 Tax=Henriciella mobilis TaxID=2305467 RepID=UPI000E675C57|nr:methyltransferase domain-containing protein [Henriciella mobilis]RIJ17990.1 methyltransferase domain-containing protein [Henriciella mobilis]RIJ25202.1 methyltransferase domain-containing protein [Henriciella mobilis]
MATAPPKLFDRNLVRLHRDRAAARYDDYAFLKERESSQLVERLMDTTKTFERALDLGAHVGRAAQKLRASGRVGAVDAADASAEFVARMKADGLEAFQLDEEEDAFETGRYDLVTSVLSLHWVNDLPGMLVRIRQGLKPDGLFLGCLFAGGTLAELRACLIEAESEIHGGASARLSPLPGLQDMAALMQRAGFALPVADIDTVTVRYDDPLKLMRDIKGMGEQAAFLTGEKGPRRPLSPAVLMRMSELYAERYSDPDGRLRATFNIVWLSGWAPHESQPKPLRPGSARHSLADAVKNFPRKD